MVLVLLWGAECRAVSEEVLAGADFLAFFMRSHRPRSMQIRDSPHPAQTSPPISTAATTTLATELITTEATPTVLTTETDTVQTTVETEPPSVVSVRVSSSVRKEAVHENVVPSSAQRSHFGVEAAGYREAEKVEDSLAEATQDFQSSQEDIPKDVEKKPYAEALTFEESALGYESRVSSETSQSRVYFSQPKPIKESVVVQASQTRKYEPRVVIAQSREETKYVPQYQTSRPKEHYETQTVDKGHYNPQAIAASAREERQYNPSVISQNIDNRQFSTQQILSQSNQEREYRQEANDQRDYSQPHEPQTYTQQPVGVSPNPEEGGQYHQKPRSLTPHVEEQHYEQPEENYEVDEAISVMTNGRAHGIQTEKPQDNKNKFGFVQEGRNYRKYRVSTGPGYISSDSFIIISLGRVRNELNYNPDFMFYIWEK